MRIFLEGSSESSKMKEIYFGEGKEKELLQI
jgi:hypothetical protein